MKSSKNTTLYSRLALITSVTLVVGYFVVYAAWTGILDSEIAPSAVVTSTLMTKIKNNLDYLSGGLANFGFSAGNVGIGTANPGAKLQINSTTGESIKMQYNGNSGFARLSTDVANSLILDTVNSVNSVVIRDITGNVGISTTDPLDKLDINGVIRIGHDGTNRGRIYVSSNCAGDAQLGVDNGRYLCFQGL